MPADAAGSAEMTGNPQRDQNTGGADEEAGQGVALEERDVNGYGQSGHHKEQEREGRGAVHGDFLARGVQSNLE